jgi:hypothetical protein
MNNYLHHVQLQPMQPNEITRILHEHRDSAVLHAVLHCLRDKSFDCASAGHSPPEVLREGLRLASTAPTSGEFRAEQAGAAKVCEEMFWSILNAGNADDQNKGAPDRT